MITPQVQAILDRHQAPAILAWRPYPPIEQPIRKSYLGGLPTLNKDNDWPRASDGTPLHFLARIDCSELPVIENAAAGQLPQQGTLQFFGRIDEEMLWCDNEDHRDHSRVIYNEIPIDRTAAPPTDLGAIEGEYHSYDRELKLPNESYSTVYPQWPLAFNQIKSWNPLISIDPYDSDLRPVCSRAMDWARASEFLRVTGYPTHPTRDPHWGEWDWRDNRRIVISPEPTKVEGETFDLGGDSDFTMPVTLMRSVEFPQVWILGERVARTIACAAIERLKRDFRRDDERDLTTDEIRLRHDMEELKKTAISWVEHARTVGLDKPPSQNDLVKYRCWLLDLCEDARIKFAGLASTGLRCGMPAAIQYCANAPAAAKLTPVSYFNELERDHIMNTYIPSRDTYVGTIPSYSYGARCHQLLGYVPTSQDVYVEGHILLLNLTSDRGVNFSFCDAGEVQFHIKPEDLAARQFDHVIAVTQGS